MSRHVAGRSCRIGSQLFKQNSLVADGFKVFRWSMNGMRDRERFILELNRFMGHARPFVDKPIFKLQRAVFTLRRHQRQALTKLDDARKNGRTTFLLVLPTGTGKTEIFIEDLVRVKSNIPQGGITKKMAELRKAESAVSAVAA